MTRLTRRISRLHEHGDAGFAMILVVGMSFLAMLLVLIITQIGISSLHATAGHVSFEQSLATAEAGIDRELSLLQSSFNQTPPVDYATASPCNVTSLPNPFPSTPDAERAWAKTAILGFPTSCTTHTSSGDYVAFRPPGKQTIYSMGWSPSRSAPGAKRRLLKAEYLFGPFKPSDAILTDGDLDFSGGSVAVNTVDPSAPADVHTNEDMTANGAGSLTVQGSLSASGTNDRAGNCPSGVSGTCTQNAPLERLYVPSPRDLYNSLATSTDPWYDLCPDGSVQIPTQAYPCNSSTNFVLSPAGDFHNWTFTAGTATAPPTWSLVNSKGTTTYPGVYYVYHGNAQVGDQGNNSTTWNITVLAESGKPGVDADVPSTYTNASTCNKYGGAIDWKLFNIQNFLQGTVFVAQGNLTGSANTTAQDGMFIAGDKVSLSTSSGWIKGAVVAGNKCAAAGGSSLQGMTVNYDQNAQVPVSSIIDTTLWLEYVG